VHAQYKAITFAFWQLLELLEPWKSTNIMFICSRSLRAAKLYFLVNKKLYCLPMRFDFPGTSHLRCGIEAIKKKIEHILNWPIPRALWKFMPSWVWSTTLGMSYLSSRPYILLTPLTPQNHQKHQFPMLGTLWHQVAFWCISHCH